MNQSWAAKVYAMGLGCYNNLHCEASTVHHRGRDDMFLVPESIFIPFWILDVTWTRGGGGEGGRKDIPSVKTCAGPRDESPLSIVHRPSTRKIPGTVTTQEDLLFSSFLHTALY